MSNMKHVFEVKTKLADTELFVYELHGTEEIGRPYSYDIVLLSEDPVELEDLLGEPLTIEIRGEDSAAYRFISGIAASTAALGRRGEYHAIGITLRPWLWVLSLTSDNRIFQNVSVLDIIKTVFGDHGFSDYNVNTSASYDTRDYCVQYGETTLDFLSRLMEEEGIYYFFEHSNGKHNMVIYDDSNKHQSMTMEQGGSEILFRPSGESVLGLQCVSEWRRKHSLQTTKMTLNSYDFENVRTELSTTSTTRQSHAHSKMERYEYGELWTAARVGQHFTDVRREEHLTGYRVIDAVCNAPGVATGFKMDLKEHPVQKENAEHLVTATTIHLRNSDIESQFSDEEAFYECQFSAIQLPCQYRSARITPKAVVRGPQTAVVVGPKGEEIWTDKYGRVKVQFHWDREGKVDENSSCWVRVATTWAGNVWGSISIPRIGQEVIIDFLEGDPDQPIITGSVYNADNMPPFPLPDNKTQSGLRTRSTKNGNAKTFNELRFEDKKDAEEVYFHAEKDFKRVVENNDHLTVGKEKKDAGDQTIEIHNNRTATLAEGDDSLTVKTGNQKIDVKKKINIKAGDELKITVGQCSLTMKSNGDITIKGKNISTDGMGKISFKAMQDFTAQGMNAKITGDIEAKMAGNAKAEVSGGGILDLKSSGMAKLKGSITMIG